MPSAEGTMKKDYYLILGVTADASSEEIQVAFRHQTLELHPDQVDLKSRRFRELQEAYGALGDFERRRRYDRQAGSLTRSHPSWLQVPKPPVREWPEGASFRPVETSSRFQEVSLAECFEVYHPSFDELFDRFWSNFETSDRPKAERLESLTVEIVVGPEQARFGGRVRLRIPARATCSICGGHGAVGSYECCRCEGHGSLTTEYPVEVAYPAGVRDEYAVQFPLTGFGIENFYLTVLLRKQ
jgi:DnaJ-class molecular chaperone